jgi:hypothetical protein
MDVALAQAQTQWRASCTRACRRQDPGSSRSQARPQTCAATLDESVSMPPGGGASGFTASLKRAEDGI